MTSHRRTFCTLSACMAALLASTLAVSAARASEGTAPFSDIPVISEVPADVPPITEDPAVPEVPADPQPPVQSETPVVPAPPTPEEPAPQPPANVPVPMVIASYTSSSVPAPGQEALIEVTFENRGETTIVSPVANFEPTSGLALVDGRSSFALDNIEPHKTCTISLNVVALEAAATTAQNLMVSTKFYYEDAGSLVEASRNDTLPVRTAATQPTPEDPAPGAEDPGDIWGGDWGGGGGITQTVTPESTVDKPVPNIIVSGFTYGDGSDAVATGSTFPLTFSFTNTSAQLAAENIVVTVDTGEKFAINGGTNTFYVPSMAPGASQQETLTVKALATEKNDPGALTIGFKYEYVDNNQRKQATSEVRLTVPTYQQDRFSLAAPTLPTDAMVGAEAMITLPYVNKGKSPVGNVAATIEGPDIQTMTSVQNLGNIEAGKSGTIGFVFTPLSGGTLDLTLTVEYENANEEPVVKTFPVSLEVMDFPAMDFGEGVMDLYDPAEFEEPEQAAAMPIWGWALIGAAIVATVALAARLHKRRKKGRHAAADDDDWDLSAPVPPIPYGAPKPPAPRTKVPDLPGAHAAAKREG